MDVHVFDRLVQSLVDDASRRTLLRRVAGTAVAGPLALVGLSAAAAQGKDKEPKKKPKKQGRNAADGCREVGHPCEGNQVCCDGLECRQTGPGNALRCAEAAGGAASTGQPSHSPVAEQEACAANCQQVTQAVIGENAAVGSPPMYWVEVACTFDAPVYQTMCTCMGFGQAGAPRVQKITLPAADICAVVIQEETQPGGQPPRVANEQSGDVQASAGTGGEANADAQGGAIIIGDIHGDNTTVTIDASGGVANADASGGDDNVVVVTGSQSAGQSAQLAEPSLLMLTLAGEVIPGRLTTYWLDTDAGRRPAPGPALVQVAEETAGTGAIVAEAMSCDLAEPQAGYDWFGQCAAPATGMQFGLYAAGEPATPLTTLPVNGQGRAYFGGLAPGTYQLKPEGGTWCYAESDRVDANGAVLVQADAESHVWSFVCGAASGS